MVLFVAKCWNTLLFCRETLKYGSFCRETLKYGTFCRKSRTYALRENNSEWSLVARKPHNLCCPATRHNVTKDPEVCYLLLHYVTYLPTCGEIGHQLYKSHVNPSAQTGGMPQCSSGCQPHQTSSLGIITINIIIITIIIPWWLSFGQSRIWSGQMVLLRLWLDMNQIRWEIYP